MLQRVRCREGIAWMMSRVLYVDGSLISRNESIPNSFGSFTFIATNSTVWYVGVSDEKIRLAILVIIVFMTVVFGMLSCQTLQSDRQVVA